MKMNFFIYFILCNSALLINGSMDVKRVNLPVDEIEAVFNFIKSYLNLDPDKVSQAVKYEDQETMQSECFCIRKSIRFPLYAYEWKLPSGAIMTRHEATCFSHDQLPSLNIKDSSNKLIFYVPEEPNKMQLRLPIKLEDFKETPLRALLLILQQEKLCDMKGWHYASAVPTSRVTNTIYHVEERTSILSRESILFFDKEYEHTPEC